MYLVLCLTSVHFQVGQQSALKTPPPFTGDTMQLVLLSPLNAISISENPPNAIYVSESLPCKKEQGVPNQVLQFLCYLHLVIAQPDWETLPPCPDAVTGVDCIGGGGGHLKVVWFCW